MFIHSGLAKLLLKFMPRPRDAIILLHKVEIILDPTLLVLYWLLKVMKKTYQMVHLQNPII